MGDDTTCEAEIFCICESAVVEDGCLNITKTFSRLMGRDFPVTRTITIALRVRFESDSEGFHEIKVSIFDLDDKLVGPPASGETDATSIGNDVHSWVQAIVELPEVRFERPGDFRFELSIDGEPIAHTWLYVISG